MVGFVCRISDAVNVCPTVGVLTPTAVDRNCIAPILFASADSTPTYEPVESVFIGASTNMVLFVVLNGLEPEINIPLLIPCPFEYTLHRPKRKMRQTFYKIKLLFSFSIV